MELVRTAVAKRDNDELFRSAHKLKGIFADFHAGKAMEAAQGLVRVGKESDFVNIVEILAKVETEFDQLMLALNESFGKK